METISKVSDTEIKITKTVPEVVEEQVVTLKSLVEKQKALQGSLEMLNSGKNAEMKRFDDAINSKEAELAIVNSQIDEANALGVIVDVPIPVEPIVEEPIIEEPINP